MPPAIKVQLLPHDPHWSQLADMEAELIAKAIGPTLSTVHHVGSTSIAGIHAKPILDLMPVVRDLTALDGRQRDMEASGYESWGELGLPGRRYHTKTDPVTGRRLAQLHCYESGSSDIVRHLAFRDYLRANPDVAAHYDRVKVHCWTLHPDDSHAYGDCKDAWIRAAEADALRWYRDR
jgi:GrpB-like predicted nucleotidyltransferase (UPF0157 family)